MYPMPEGPVFRRVRRLPRRRVVLEVEYDGSAFHGFQRQPGQRTVEGELVTALTAAGLTGGLGFASRTDTGVHARGQVVAFVAPLERSPEEWAVEIAARLPPDVHIRRAAAAPRRFHPRWSATGKRYVYRLAPARTGERAPDFWDEAVSALERARLEEALAELRDAPSLEGFTAAGAPVRGAPPLTRLDLEQAESGWALIIEGPAFRRYAIRHMVGCAVAQAAGELPPGSCARGAASPPPWRGPRAPASGLTLERVDYPAEVDPFPSSDG